MSELKQGFIKNAPEVWRSIELYPIIPGMYEVSDAGNVRNTITGHIMSQNILNTGYYYCTLATVEGGKHFLTHRLVATAFIPNPDNKETVNHLDSKIMNYSHRLEWATQQENNLHARSTGRNRISCEDNYNATMSNSQVEDVCKMIEMGMDYNSILDSIGMDKTDNNRDLISNIKRGISWKEISINYDFSDIDYTYNRSIFDRDTIELICIAIANGKSNKEIIEEVLGMTYINAAVNKREYECIRRIRNKQQYTEISDKYLE